MTEFQEKLRQQHEESMHRDLEALLNTANKAEAEVWLSSERSLLLLSTSVNHPGIQQRHQVNLVSLSHGLITE